MKDRFVLPTFRSECSDLLQGEDETSVRHLSLYSLASHQVLSLELSVGATDKPVFHTLESENPTFLMTTPVEKPALNINYM